MPRRRSGCRLAPHTSGWQRLWGGPRTRFARQIAVALRGFGESREQLERLDADHYFAHQARTILAFTSKDSPGMLRSTQAWSEQLRADLRGLGFR